MYLLVQNSNSTIKHFIYKTPNNYFKFNGVELFEYDYISGIKYASQLILLLENEVRPG